MKPNRSSDGAAPLLRVVHLKAHLPTERGLVRAVDDVTFTLKRGETLGLVGESGCGKSMLCRALMGLLPRTARVPADTRIRFNGCDLRSLSNRAFNRIRGRAMAMIFQDPLSSLNPVMTIGAQVAEPLRHHLRLKRGEARRRAADLLASVGLPLPKLRLDHFPHQLSGGLRQRVAIAMALACEPQLLIADEPTTALDVTVQAEILALLAEKQQERRMAMILVTHDLGVVAGRTHDTAVMYAGRIVEQAPTAKLFATPRMPYTQALLNAVPRLEDPPHTRLAAINGQPPDLVAPPAGCRFAPRCERARTRCTQEAPPLTAGRNPHHRFACWYPCRPTVAEDHRRQAQGVQN